MLLTNRNNTNIGMYDGFKTNLLVGEINSGSKEISIQITDVEPQKMQTLHYHPQDQCYYVIKGVELMIIDSEEQEVKAGDSIFIPSNAKHGIKNIGEDILTYLTANRSFGKEIEKQTWSIFNTSKDDES